ncbi:MAG: tail fiber domain-containing protein [Planctomycetota bacterium]|jgi:hypothetical protein
MVGKLRRLFFIVMFLLVVIGFYSTNRIACAVGNTTYASGDCGKCDGKVTELTLQYNGTVDGALIDVVQKKNLNVFTGYLNPGDEFTFSGLGKNGTMGTEISIFVDGILSAKIHTSCSKPIGPGLVSGDFQVIMGYSLNGGPLCAVDRWKNQCNKYCSKPCKKHGMAGKYWKTRGNDNINPDVHFLGTKNPAALVIKTNNDEKMRVTSSGNVGIGDTMPEFKLSLDNDGGIIARGEFGSGNILSASGEGARLIWYPKKAAFRAGEVTGTAFLDEWDEANIGNHSTAVGNSTKASGDSSTAMGNGSTASDFSSTAMGNGSTASGFSSTAMGNGSTASGFSSTATGNGSDAIGDSSTATGNGSAANGNNSTAMGNGSEASGDNSTAMGNGSEASGNNSTAMGNGTTASGNDSTAMGSGTTAGGTVSTAMGNGTTASGDNSTSMGSGTTAESYLETVIGKHDTNYTPNSTTTWDGSDRLFVIGNGTSSSSRSDAFTVLKNGTVSGTFGTYHAPSDKRLKKDIVTIQNALEKVSRLRGVNFKWKDDPNNEPLKMGMVAQEVEKVVPEVVHTADDVMNTKAVEYQYLVGLLIEAIKELKAENEVIRRDNIALKAENENTKKTYVPLKAENEQLKGKLMAMESRLDDLENMFLAISTILPKQKLVKLEQVKLDGLQKTVQ